MLAFLSSLRGRSEWKTMRELYRAFYENEKIAIAVCLRIAFQTISIRHIFPCISVFYISR